LGIADHLARVVEGQETQDPIENSDKSMNLAEPSFAKASDASCQGEATNREPRASASEEGGLETTGSSKRTNNDTTRAL
jgi:hypothetical protein